MEHKKRLSNWFNAELAFMRSIRDHHTVLRIGVFHAMQRIHELEKVYEDHLALSRENAALRMKNQELENQLTKIRVYAQKNESILP